MQLVGRRSRIQSATTALFLLFCTGNAGTITTAPKAVPTSNPTQTCEFRTINYITDSLPQQCLKSAWSQANGTASAKVGGLADSTAGLNASITSTSHGDGQNIASVEAVEGDSATSSPSASSTTSSETVEASPSDLETGELNDASFLSFEEWRKQTLEKAGQQNANIGGKKSGENKKRDSESFQNNLDSLGDEGEIDLDFAAFRAGENGEEVSKDAVIRESGAKHEGQEHGVVKKDQYRSKDAGKTCKERFSYASFDAGATIVKTHHGAKNAKAVLIENKDSYMLSECTAENKFLIIELSEDIWIDTLVLANYEFFSSMIKTFRVSVSDRYPVKIEKWKDVGTYEARNSREIQAFLIENPQIWARYIKIEFLTHYGNEYYCPLSLVRVHGTRMLESWKESEANNEEENESEEPAPEERFIPEAIADTVLEEEKLQAELKEAQAAIENLVREAQNITATFAETAINSSHLKEVNTSLENVILEQMTTPWVPDFDFGAWMNISKGLDVCLPKESPPPQTTVASTSNIETVTSITGYCSEPTSLTSLPVANNSISTATLPPDAAESIISSEITSVETNSEAIPTSSSITSSLTTSNSTVSSTSSAPTVTPATKSQNATSLVKTKASSTSSSPSSLPTQQESFFKAVSRRLQLLEANSTLSLKYIEEQSKILREAFTKVEKKQLQKTTTFLDIINGTVFTELRQIRQQYDEIWQSTVISLESQREESKKEILAITSRLNILADEVVFQKRMSIVQSVLLLLCLGLVIFSRVSTTSPSEYPSKSRFLNFSVESPIETSLPGSPEYIMPEDELPNGRHEWIGNGHARQQSDDSIVSLEDENDRLVRRNMERFKEESPPTPISPDSRSDLSLSPPSRGNASTPPTFLPHPLTSHPTTTTIEPEIPTRISSFNEVTEPPIRSNSNGKSNQRSESPIRAPKKKKGFIRQQQPSPPIDDDTVVLNGNGAPPVPIRTHQPQAQNHNQAPIINTMPASPVQGQGGRRNRNSSGGSFSIARKPLPALPNGDEG